MSAWSSSARAVAVIVCALSAVVSCGSDNSSKAVPGAGGDSDSGGTGNDGQGDSPGAGPGGGTQSGSGTGTFGSIWKQTKSEVLAFDSANGGIPKQAEVKIPALYPVWETDTDAEMYTTFKDDQLWLYAFVQGSSSYFLVKTAALVAAEDVITFQLATMSGIYTLSEGVLTRTSTNINGTLLASTTTTYEPYTDAFPPEGWPSQEVVLDLTTGGAL
jgi:hypothetical protein